MVDQSACGVFGRGKSASGMKKSNSFFPICKGKGDQNECNIYWEMSLLRIPGKVYGRVLIKKIRCIIEGLIGEE